MTNARRAAAAAATLFLAALAAAGPAAFAQATSNTVGPENLKDFRLPGQRTTPPAPTPAPAPPSTAERPVERRADPAPTTTTPPRRADRAPATAPRVETEPPPQRSASASAPAAAAPADEAAPAPSIDVPPPAPAQPQGEAPSPPVADAQAQSSGRWWALAAAAAALLGGLGFLLLRRRRRGTQKAALEQAGPPLAAAQPAEPPVQGPTAEPEVAAAAAAAAAGEQRRPWLEIDIKPERASATASETTVQYALVLRNRGNAPARNIRIDARLFNASDKTQAAAFFEGPIHEQSGSPHVTIAPDGSLTLMGQVAMPKAEAREIEVDGLRIFVPMVAINVAYDWAGGTGRTSRSWLVGRESEASEKMGPFRLDLSPRIYRSVGRREAMLAMV